MASTQPTAPSPKPVSPLEGLHRIENPVSNSYLFRDTDGIYIVDTGFFESAKPIAAALPELTEGGKVPVRGILLTHQHLDHMGGAARLHWLTDAPVSAHRFDVPAIEGIGPLVGPPLITQLFRKPAVKVANVLQDGATVGPFTVLHVPGHTPGSVAFLHKARGLLFTGDSLIVGKRGSLTTAKRSLSYDPEEAALSLRKFAGLTIEAVLPGHGDPVTQDPSGQLAAAVDRLSHPEAKEDKTLFGPDGRPEIHPGMPGWREG
ncbi:MAG: MBL fold metallo-hydrolase [Candidatus Thermoplasmatota archaeon]|nr:MBL fold metallo-hydrolase [Candidatus Thermoplasmatota archaeon]